MRKRFVFLILVSCLAATVVALCFWPKLSSRVRSSDATPNASIPTASSQEKTRQVSGVVFNASKTPMAGVRVDLLRSQPTNTVHSKEPRREKSCDELLKSADDQPVEHQPSAILQSTNTDAEGRFVFDDVKSLDVNVLAEHRDSGSFAFLTASAEHPNALRLKPKRKLQGTIADKNRKLLSGKVTVVSMRTGQTVTAETDGRRHFEVPDLMEGPWSVVVQTSAKGSKAMQLADLSEHPLSVIMTESASLQVLLVAGGRPIDGELEIERGGVRCRVSSTGGRIVLESLKLAQLTLSASANGWVSTRREVGLREGRIEVELELFVANRLTLETRDPDKNAIGGVELTVIEGTAVGTVNGSRQTPGELVVQVAVDQSVVVELKKPGFETKRVAVEKVSESQRMRVVLERAMTLSGRVVDVNGQPVAGAQVGVTATGAVTLSEENGRFVLPRPSSGQFRLVAYHDERGGAEAIVDDLEAPIEMVLGRGAELEVQLGLEGEPIEGAKVAVTCGALRFDCPRHSDTNGYLLMFGLPDGECTADIQVPKIVGTFPDLVSLRSKRRAVLTFGAVSSGAGDDRVKGIVNDERGRPLGGVVLFVRSEADTVQRVVSDRTGTFLIERVGHGVKFSLWPDEQSKVLVPNFVGEYEYEARFVLLRPKRYHGRVIVGDGRGNAAREGERDIPITHFTINGRQFQSADGRFELEAAGPFNIDEVQLTVTAPGFSPGLYVRRKIKAFDYGDIQLEPKTIVRGIVRDPSNQLVKAAEVSCGEAWTPTSSDRPGWFALDCSPAGGLAPAVEGRAEGLFGSVPLDRELVANLDEVELKLAPLVHVKGQVTLLDGTPVAGAKVEYFSRAEQNFRRPFEQRIRLLVTDRTGAYQGALPAGIYDVEVKTSRDELLDGFVRVRLSDRERTVDLVRQSPRHSLTVTGVFPRHGNVSMWLSDGPGSDEAQVPDFSVFGSTSPNGEPAIAFKNLPRGTYLLKRNPSADEPEPLTITIHIPEQTSVAYPP